MSERSVGDIVRHWLKSYGCDGLVSWNGGCGCQLSDLMPCNGEVRDCVAAKKVPCPGDECDLGGDCEWHMAPAKLADVARWFSEDVAEAGGGS